MYRVKCFIYFPKCSILCLAFFLIYIPTSLGQISIKGTINSTNHEIIPNVSVLAYAVQDTVNILTFAITDGDGNFILKLACPSDSIYISTRSLSFRDTLIKVSNTSQYLKIFLPAQTREIKEVNVRAYPISARGDTINYIVNGFAKKQDQSIGDVIANMPGFEVSKLGQIYYHGKPIQKYYIEGLDLLENRYVIANRNLPHKSVGSVEVLQNHQPIKLLEDKISSDETSINIKLKKDVAITGTLYAGVGASPFLHDINLTPMLFHKKQQMIASWQSNNIGNDLNTQHQPLVFSNGKLSGHKNRKLENLHISTLTKPKIDKQWFLNNNANLLSYNHLIKLNKKNELKINSSYYKDILKEEGSTSNSYFLDDKTISIDESTRNHYFNESISTDLTLTQNNKNRYLTNKLSLQKFWDSEEGIIFSQTELSQKAATPHFSLSNEFDLLLPVKNNFIRFYSFIDHNQSPESMLFIPGVFPEKLTHGQNYNSTIQNYITGNFTTQHNIEFSIKQNHWIYETTMGIIYEKQWLKTSIVADGIRLNSDSLRNKLHWNNSELYLSEKLMYKKDNFLASLSIPLRRISSQITDSYHHTPKHFNKFLITPSLRFKLNFAKYMAVSLSAKYNSKLGEVNQLTEGYIISSHRQLTMRSNELINTFGFSYSSKLEYKNPISGYFSSVSWLHNQNTNNLLIQQKVTDEGLLFYDIKEVKNRTLSNLLSLKASQFIAKFQTTISLNSSYSRLQKDYILNNQLGQLNLGTLAIEPGLSLGRWKHINFGYNYSLQYINQKSISANISIVEEKHKVDICLTPNERHLIGTNCEFYSSMHTGQKPLNLFFSNLSYLYKPKKGKLKFKVNLNNILNSTQIVNYYHSDISLTQTTYKIRPRQLVTTILIGL